LGKADSWGSEVINTSHDWTGASDESSEGAEAEIPGGLHGPNESLRKSVPHGETAQRKALLTPVVSFPVRD